MNQPVTTLPKTAPDAAREDQPHSLNGSREASCFSPSRTVICSALADPALWNRVEREALYGRVVLFDAASTSDQKQDKRAPLRLSTPSGFKNEPEGSIIY